MLYNCDLVYLIKLIKDKQIFMLNFLRTTFTAAEQADLDQEKYMEETCRFYGKRATQFVNSYQLERQWKQNYILVNVMAEGYDIKRWLEYMMQQKSNV